MRWRSGGAESLQHGGGVQWDALRLLRLKGKGEKSSQPEAKDGNLHVPRGN